MTIGRIQVTMCLPVEERFVSPRSTTTRTSACPLTKGGAVLGPQPPEEEARSSWEQDSPSNRTALHSLEATPPVPFPHVAVRERERGQPSPGPTTGAVGVGGSR